MTELTGQVFTDLGLRACPHCGKDAYVSTGDTWEKGSHIHIASARCRGCDATGPMVSSDTRDGIEGEAARLWNTRVSDGLVTELVDVLDAIVRHHITTLRADGVRDATSALTRAREAGYGSNLQKMQTTQGGE